LTRNHTPMMTTAPRLPAPLNVLRHGVTEPNLAGLRCGGDLDVELTDLGRRQAIEAALRIRELRLPVGLIVTSPLLRTSATAQLVSRVLGGVGLLVEAGFSERRLGQWNLQPVADTEAALAAGETPPGGEPDAEFVARIERALEGLLPHLDRQPLLVGSKGVVRAIGEVLGAVHRGPLGNGQLAHFDLAAFAARRSLAVPP